MTRSAYGIGAGMLLLVSCAEADIPTGVNPAPALAGSFTLTGRVVRNHDGSPIPGVLIELTQAGQSVTQTDAQGEFGFGSVPAGSLRVSLSAPGFLTRLSRITVDSSRNNLVVDLISTAPPFSLQFYRQFVRNEYDSRDLSPIRRYTVSPAFYVRTVTEDDGRAVPLPVVEGVARVLANAAPELSGGRLPTSRVETGVEFRPEAHGWVTVTFHHSLPGGVRGQATVGGDSGWIRLRYDPALDGVGQDDARGCESATVWYADHEVVHTMGFFHTAQTHLDFYSDGACSGVNRPLSTRFHAATAYSRPPGNQHPDTDPPTFSYATTEGSPRLVVSCLYGSQ